MTRLEKFFLAMLIYDIGYANFADNENIRWISITFAVLMAIGFVVVSGRRK